MDVLILTLVAEYKPRFDSSSADTKRELRCARTLPFS
jgi:hypothetical protein